MWLSENAIKGILLSEASFESRAKHKAIRKRILSYDQSLCFCNKVRSSKKNKQVHHQLRMDIAFGTCYEPAGGVLGEMILSVLLYQIHDTKQTTARAYKANLNVAWENNKTKYTAVWRLDFSLKGVVIKV